MEETTTSGLSAAEEAYFESGGATEVTQELSAPEPSPPTLEVDQQQPDPTEETQTRDEKGRFVPHQALHAEREEHKKTRTELQTIRERQAVLEDRWNTLLKSATPEEPKVDDSPPDPNVDIFAFAQWQAKKSSELEARLKERDTAEVKAREAQEQEQAIWGHWQQSAQQFASQNPDFGNAAEYLADLRQKQLSAIGLDAAGINQTINEELKGVIIQGARSQKSPAELIYNYAVASGYSKVAPQSDPGKLELPDNLAKIAAAQEASKTLGAASGRAGGDEMTAEKLLDMPPHEFDKWAKENATLYRKLLGG